MMDKRYRCAWITKGSLSCTRCRFSVSTVLERRFQCVRAMDRASRLRVGADTSDHVSKASGLQWLWAQVGRFQVSLRLKARCWKSALRTSVIANRRMLLLPALHRLPQVPCTRFDKRGCPMCEIRTGVLHWGCRLQRLHLREPIGMGMFGGLVATKVIANSMFSQCA